MSEAEEERLRRIRIEAGLGCAKCDYTGVLSGKLGGKWTHYPQIPCDCRLLTPPYERSN